MQAAQTIAAPAPRTSRARPAAAPVERTVWWQATWFLALVGSVLSWLALPPADLWPLAWLAPVPWVLLMRRTRLAGRRPYLVIWLAGLALWLATLYWMTLPHPATAIGWVALSLYLACYLPALVGIGRIAVQGLRISPIVAAPLVWVGLEYLRAHLLGGFAMASIAHTQYRWVELIQVSDTFGFYGVSFVVVFAAACLARMVPMSGERLALWPLLPLATLFGAALAYGSFRVHQQTTRPGPKVALVQGSIDIDMKYDEKLAQQIFQQYYGLSRRAIEEHPDLDLIVWPETMYRDPWYAFAADYQPPADVAWTPAEIETRSRDGIALVVRRLGVACLLGIDTVHYRPGGFDHFNSALLVDRGGQVRSRYDKVNLVPFGEYVPFADVFPWLYQLTPLPSGSAPGEGPQSMELDAGGSTVRIVPNICYENTLPHFVRRQVTTLRDREYVEPDLLVNLTNDGWFWGSAELDLHLACAIFRAVECRKPLLIAANTGFSAAIDSNGRLRAKGRRRATDLLIATPGIDSRRSWYLAVGDTGAALCLAATVGIIAAGALRRRKLRAKAGSEAGQAATG